MTKTSGQPTLQRERNVLPELSLRTWLLGSHLVVLLLPLLALIGTGALAMDLRRQTRVDLEHQADVLAIVAADILGRGEVGEDDRASPEDFGARFDPLLAEVRLQTLASLRILDAQGRVLAASAGDELDARDMSDDPVVAAALRGETGVEIRPRPLHGRAR